MAVFLSSNDSPHCGLPSSVNLSEAYMRSKSENLLEIKFKEKGIESFSDSELVAIALEKNIKNTERFQSNRAEEVMEALYTSTSAEKLYEKLEKADLDEGKKLEITALFELFRRTHGKRGKKILNANDVFDAIRHFFSEDQEKVITIGVNGANEVVYTSLITVGLVNMSLFHPREAFAEAIEKRCVGIFIAHNHPTRTLNPSENDRFLTKRIYEAGKILGVDLIDHIIFSDEGYYSLSEHKELTGFAANRLRA